MRGGGRRYPGCLNLHGGYALNRGYDLEQSGSSAVDEARLLARELRERLRHLAMVQHLLRPLRLAPTPAQAPAPTPAPARFQTPHGCQRARLPKRSWAGGGARARRRRAVRRACPQRPGFVLKRRRPVLPHALTSYELGHRSQGAKRYISRVEHTVRAIEYMCTTRRCARVPD